MIARASFRMDPLCHTLVGWSLARAGLRDRTPLATTALVLGANAPDIDAITYFTGSSLWWRRGWTHGVLALGAWPFAIAAILLIVARTFGHASHRRPPPKAATLIWISALGVWTHPLLDFLNNYGVRWLMPFNTRWFYGDALFIVEPLIWLCLLAGLCASWYAERHSLNRVTPARWALVIVSVYAVVMLALGHGGRAVVNRQFADRGRAVNARTMVSPVLGGLSLRYVVADAGPYYYVAGFRWWPSATLDPGWRTIAKNDRHPAVEVARRAPVARGFVAWTRFPFYVVDELEEAFLVTMDDARYAPATGHSWAAVQVRVPKQVVDGTNKRGHPSVPAS